MVDETASKNAINFKAGWTDELRETHITYFRKWDTLSRGRGVPSSGHQKALQQIGFDESAVVLCWGTSKMDRT